MFDSHCHLDADEYAPDRREVIARARDRGVTGIMVPGIVPSAWAGLPTLCSLDPMLRFGVGLHPWYVHEVAEPLQALADLPARATELGASAIGECGLDAPVAKRGGADLETQTRVLALHLKAARALSLPIILHCVGAHARLLTLLESEDPLPAGGVLHSYSGSKELVPRYLELGLSFSFAGILTRDNARRPREALRAVPLDRLLVESDGPDQAAKDVMPRRSEPAHVALVLAAAARHRGESASVLARVTSDNADNLFGRKLAHFS